MQTTVFTLAQTPRETQPQHKERTRTTIPTPVEEEILLDLYTFDFLTVNQVMRLRYTDKSHNYVGLLLSSLLEKKYVHRNFIPRKQRSGNAPAVFFLSRHGVKHLQLLGYPPPHKRYERAEVETLTYLFWAHTLAVNDVLIAAKRVEHIAPGVLLNEFRHDKELKKHPFSVTVPNVKKQVGVVLDAWLDFRLPSPNGGDPVQIALPLELDRGSMPVAAMKKKFRALLAFIDGPYQQAFYTNSVTICFPTQGGPRRVALLRSWLHQVLQEDKREADNQFFLFTALPPLQGNIDIVIDPVHFFFSPTWLTACDNTPKTLLAP